MPGHTQTPWELGCDDNLPHTLRNLLITLKPLNNPDSNVNDMGPLGSCRSQLGPMLAPWTLLSGNLWSGDDGGGGGGGGGTPTGFFEMRGFAACHILQYNCQCFRWLQNITNDTLMIETAVASEVRTLRTEIIEGKRTELNDA